MLDTTHSILTIHCFNRYMVECEFCKAYNQTSTISSFNRYMVECESPYLQKSKCRGDCFNRYMVECECICSFCCINLIVVLIDTWWNVNAEIIGEVERM